MNKLSCILMTEKQETSGGLRETAMPPILCSSLYKTRVLKVQKVLNMSRNLARTVNKVQRIIN